MSKGMTWDPARTGAPEPRDEVAAPPPLARPDEHRIPSNRNGCWSSSQPAAMSTVEDRPLRDREGGLVGQGHANGYCQIGHGGVLSWQLERTLRAPSLSVGMSFGTGSRVTLTGPAGSVDGMQPSGMKEQGITRRGGEDTMAPQTVVRSDTASGNPR
jgi:hypothetical protein